MRRSRRASRAAAAASSDWQRPSTVRRSSVMSLRRELAMNDVHSDVTQEGVMETLVRRRNVDYGRLVRREALTFRRGGLKRAAWFYRPAAERPLPCVVLARVGDGVREQLL